jgi:AraC-like DNA-binding protein
VPERTRILPDGCLDLIWTGRHLLVAGPDPEARWNDSNAGDCYVGLRLFGGLGAAALGVSAAELVGRMVLLADLLPSRDARRISEQVRSAPEAAMQSWVAGRASRLDRTGPRVLAMAAAGLSVAEMTDELGCGARQLHRRCLSLFGYGPRRLGRIVRLQTALGRMSSGTPLAEVAALGGFADQAHLSREVRALAGTTPRSLAAERGEQVDRPAIGIVDDRVAHPPERVPGRQVAFVAGVGELGVGGVDLRG